MSEKVKEKAEKLSPKQRLFVSAYLGQAKFNATAAARLAGYKGNAVTLGAVGAENLKKPQIKTAIDGGLTALTMPANEVLARITDIAKGKVTDVVDSDGRFDLKTAKANGKDGLLKKIKIKRTSRVIRERDENGDVTDTDIETSILTEEIEFELHSAHEALRDLGKYHKLWTDKHEIEATLQHTVVRVPEKLSPEKWKEQLQLEK